MKTPVDQLISKIYYFSRPRLLTLLQNQDEWVDGVF